MKIKFSLYSLPGGAVAAVAMVFLFAIAASHFLNDVSLAPLAENEQNGNPFEMFKGAPNAAPALKEFMSPDGQISFRYPAAFDSGDNQVSQTNAGALQLQEGEGTALFIAQKTDFSNFHPAYLIVTNHGTSTEAMILERIKTNVEKTGGRAEAALLAESAGNNIAVAEVTHAYPIDNPLAQWKSRHALAHIGENIIAVTVTTTQTNWSKIEPVCRTIFDSIQLHPTAPAGILPELK